MKYIKYYRNIILVGNKLNKYHCKYYDLKIDERIERRL